MHVDIRTHVTDEKLNLGRLNVGRMSSKATRPSENNPSSASDYFLEIKFGGVVHTDFEDDPCAIIVKFVVKLIPIKVGLKPIVVGTIQSSVGYMPSFGWGTSAVLCTVLNTPISRAGEEWFGRCTDARELFHGPMGDNVIGFVQKMYDAMCVGYNSYEDFLVAMKLLI